MERNSALEKIQALSWLSPASFALFMCTMILIYILPIPHRVVFAAIEWSEMVGGTFLSLFLLAVVFFNRRRDGLLIHRSPLVLTILGSILWALFWIVALLSHRGLEYPELQVAPVALMDLAELAGKIRTGDRSELNLFKRMLAAENDVGALKKIAKANWQEAEISIPTYQRVLEISPKDDEALASLGLVKYLIGEDKEASQCLEKAISINPDGLEVLTLQAALEKGPDEQLKIYKKILELDPTNRVALHNLARLQNEM